MTAEDIAYKTADHEFRSVDEYAQGKYDLTSRWLRPRVRPGQLLLNIGCGSGEYNATAAAMNLRVVACEPEPNAYAIAARTKPAGCELHPCGLMELAQHTEPADFIVMHDVLEHIEDDAAAVDALAALLVPGGTAIISVPAYQWLFGHHDVQLGHYRRYTRRSLVERLRTKFEIQVARYYGAALIPVALWFSRIARKPYPLASAGTGLTHTAMRLICQTESHIPMPVGTSVVVCVTKS